MRTTAVLALWSGVAILSGCGEQSALTRPGNPDETLPVIITLETRDGVITVMAGPEGPVYTLRKKDDRILGQRLSEQQLQVQLPHIHHLLKTSYAEDEQGGLIWAGRVARDPPR